MRGFMGILSITATAVVSTLVQRYFAAAPADGTSIRSAPIVQSSPNAQLQAPVSDSANSPLQSETRPSDRPISAMQADSPIQVETQPVPDSSIAPIETAGASEQPEATNQPGAIEQQPSQQSGDVTLREKLDSALRDKWNKQ